MLTINNETLQYYAKGGMSGMFGIILSHPIDTVKTHIQSGNALKTFKPHITNLYKGISAPLLGVGVEKAIVFGTYNYCMREKSLPIYASGAIAGLSASVIVTPYERIKILKQSNTINKIAIKQLTPSFLFKGLSTTFTREVPGFAIYFSVYEYLKYNFHTKHGKHIDYLDSFIYGGLSGTTAWVFIYPQDRIKTILQMQMTIRDTNGQVIAKQTIPNIIKSIYNGGSGDKGGGITQFYRGFSWAVARAILLHSGTFCMMEILNDLDIVEIL
jgi:solute carrier family 25 carnitine/acylcarnitine transporter 20/29